AAHIKNVPGRKTDVKDADWTSDLLAHGLIRPSFVPDPPTQEMRTFLRTRKQFVREKSSHILRIQKTLEDANIKLDSVITEIMGVSGRKMIEALIAGEEDPAKLARLADRRVKASQESLREALRGRVTKSHRFLLRLHLGHIDALDAAIAQLDREVEAAIAPFRTAVEVTRFAMRRSKTARLWPQGKVGGLKQGGAAVLLPVKEGETGNSPAVYVAPLRQALIDTSTGHVNVVVCESDYRALKGGIENLP